MAEFWTLVWCPHCRPSSDREFANYETWRASAVRSMQPRCASVPDGSHRLSWVRDGRDLTQSRESPNHSGWKYEICLIFLRPEFFPERASSKKSEFWTNTRRPRLKRTMKSKVM